MKMLRFIFYVLYHGRLFKRPVNFNTIEEEHLRSLSLINYQQKKATAYYNLRGKLAHNILTGSLIGNIAYIKNLPTANKNYFFVDELELGYLRILKSASTSMLRALLPMIENRLQDKTLTDKQIDLLAAHYAHTEISPARQHYNLFTIVRSPFQRIVSVYLDIFDKENPYFGYETYFFGILKRNMSFPDFVKVISLIPDKFKSGHFLPQMRIIEDCGGLKKIKCYRLDKDRELLETFLKSKNLRLNHSNKQEAGYDYRSFYNHQTAAAVYNIYHKDITVFDYESEYESLLSHLKG